jgi:hypothetical protein
MLISITTYADDKSNNQANGEIQTGIGTIANGVKAFVNSVENAILPPKEKTQTSTTIGIRG